MDRGEGAAICFDSEDSASAVWSLCARGSVQMTIGGENETSLRTNSVSNFEFIDGSEGGPFGSYPEQSTDAARSTGSRGSIEKAISSEDDARLRQATVAAVAIERVDDIKRTAIFLDPINGS
jgi:hypothetical protein